MYLCMYLVLYKHSQRSICIGQEPFNASDKNIHNYTPHLKLHLHYTTVGLKSTLSGTQKLPVLRPSIVSSRSIDSSVRFAAEHQKNRNKYEHAQYNLTASRHLPGIFPVQETASSQLQRLPEASHKDDDDRSIYLTHFSLHVCSGYKL